jgi:hypothetical protein
LTAATYVLAVPVVRALEVPEADEAEWLALHLSDEPLPPPELVLRIRADLAAVREAIPALEHVTITPEWEPGKLIVDLTAEALASFLAGTHVELNELNEDLGPLDHGPVDDEFAGWFPDALFFSFDRPYHPDRVGALYDPLPGVEATHRWWPTPPWYLPCDIPPSQVSSPEPGRYTFWLSWSYDCLFHSWEVLVEDGVVTVVAESGDPLPVASVSWSQLKGTYGGRARRPWAPFGAIRDGAGMNRGRLAAPETSRGQAERQGPDRLAPNFRYTTPPLLTMDN